MLPNFIAPGAQKSGTTALRIYLAQHPEIFMVDKEIHFFDDRINFNKGVSWYEKFFDKWNGEKAIGEKTPNYLYDEKTPERIYNTLPNVKLIFLFRNPINRAYSHYWHNVRKGQEKYNFEKAIRMEENRTKDPEKGLLYPYKGRGEYILQVKRYDKFFNKSQMLFLLTEDLKENREKTVKKVLKFLGVESEFQFNDLGEKFVGGVPRSQSLAKIAGNSNVRKIKYLKYFINKINVKREIPPMKLKMRKYLEEYFKDYNEELEKFTGLDLNKWR